MPARWRVEVDRDVCVGSGMCAALAPDSFALGPDRRSRPLEEETDPREDVLEAAENCPVEAISVRVAGAGVFPAGD
ncbi:ferredoxin [Streptomyces gamaensis]|uniref:Ferredoxin n=1 Tax=Streptomyces gamaensis TaxID=1763542 RepID=A0ABW0YX68_9ACTN